MSLPHEHDAFGPRLQPPWPGDPGVVVFQRPISPQEQAERAKIAERGGYHPRFGWVALGGFAVLFAAGFLPGLAGGIGPALLMGLAISGAGVVLFFLVYVFGFPVIRRAQARTLEAELGPGRVLAVAWNAWGFTVGGGQLQHAHAYDDIWYCSVRQAPSGASYLCMRHNGNVGSAEGMDPPILAIPLDLVPQAALGELRARGTLST